MFCYIVLVLAPEKEDPHVRVCLGPVVVLVSVFEANQRTGAITNAHKTRLKRVRIKFYAVYRTKPTNTQLIQENGLSEQSGREQSQVVK